MRVRRSKPIGDLEKAFLRCFREVSAAGDSPYGRALLSGKRMVIADVEEDRLSPFRQLAHSAGLPRRASYPNHEP